MSKDENFDVCVIGSGAAGGVMAKELCEGGAKVVMLEAGRGVPLPELLSHKWPYELPFRGFRGEKQAPFYQGDIAKSIAYADSDHVSVDRVRALGGRTLHWNAVTLRYAPRDFKEWSLQGIEEDWPLSYEELEPYYDRIEQIIGVCGNDDHLEILPAGKNYLPPIPWRCSEHIMKRATNAMGIPLIAVRKAVLTRPLRSAAALPLLWPLHGWMRRRVDLQHARLHVAQSSGYRQFHPSPECPGARGPGRPRRPGERGLLHRHRDAHGTAGQGEDRCGLLLHRGVCQTPAQFTLA